MASKKLALDSVITGHHVYKSTWTPYIGEILRGEVEENNEHDKYAVSIKKDGEIVGHIPRSLSKLANFFLRHHGSIKCTVTGKRRKGNGLEVPCQYSFEGTAQLIKKLERNLKI